MATEVEQHVSVENESGIGWIRFNRPEKMNAIGALTRKQLAESIKQAERDDAVRVVVLTGVTRGLGRALAEGMAALGHRVAGCGRTGAAIESLRSSLGDAHDFRAEGNIGDEMPIHDVEMQPIAAATIGSQRFPGKVSEVSRQQGRRNYHCAKANEIRPTASIQLEHRAFFR